MHTPMFLPTDLDDAGTAVLVTRLDFSSLVYKETKCNTHDVVLYIPSAMIFSPPSPAMQSIDSNRGGGSPGNVWYTRTHLPVVLHTTHTAHTVPSGRRRNQMAREARG